MSEIKKLGRDPFFEFCLTQIDSKGEPFCIVDTDGGYSINYKCTLNLERIKYAYKQYIKKR